MSFEQEALNDLLDVKGWIVSFLSAKDDVFQVEEHRHRRIRIIGVHSSSKAMPEAEINHGFSGSRSAQFGGRLMLILNHRLPPVPESRFPLGKFSLREGDALFETCDSVASPRSFATHFCILPPQPYFSRSG